MLCSSSRDVRRYACEVGNLDTFNETAECIAAVSATATATNARTVFDPTPLPSGGELMKKTRGALVTDEEETKRAITNSVAAPPKSTSEIAASLQRIVKTCQGSEGQRVDAQRYSMDPEATEKPTAAVSTTAEPSCDPGKCETSITDEAVAVRAAEQLEHCKTNETTPNIDIDHMSCDASSPKGRLGEARLATDERALRLLETPWKIVGKRPLYVAELFVIRGS